MNELHTKSVVVGIDGSQAAVGAAKWAVDEALSRRIPLRLVHVVGRKQAQSPSPQTSDWELKRGEAALDHAACAVQDVEKPVEVETVLLSGDPGEILIDESMDAALVCIGTDRHGWTTDKLLGTTEAALATRAHCPVAIIRTNPYGTPAEPGVIAVVLNDEPDNDEVVHQALDEARLRHVSLREIDRRLDSWVRRFPDVPVQLVAAGTGMKASENHSSAIELAVVGKADADEISELNALSGHPIAGYPDCSVLLIRH